LHRRPLHPYSEALIAAQPRPVPSALRPDKRVLLRGDIPSPLNPPAGCRFHTRCTHAIQTCGEIRPELEGQGERLVACHLSSKLQLTGDPVGTRAPDDDAKDTA